MIEFGWNAVTIFGFSIYYYGIILMSGVVAASLLSARVAKNRGENPDFLWDLLPWIVVAGVIGARLWHIFTPPPSMIEQGITTQYYLTHPLEALNLRNGGLGIPGAVIAGLLAAYYYCKIKKQNLWKWADIIVVGLPLGQAIGRFGNYVNQELYGAPTDLPWGIFIDIQRRLPDYLEFSHYHPIFLYEALWSFATVGLLLWIGNKYQKSLKLGDMFLIYLITYPTIRIILDFLRLDASEIGGLNANQSFMVVILIASAVTLFLRHKKKK
jgi:phosphatidylglycerol:prolipoprotein diacylglycerol transferase